MTTQQAQELQEHAKRMHFLTLELESKIDEHRTTGSVNPMVRAFNIIAELHNLSTEIQSLTA